MFAQRAAGFAHIPQELFKKRRFLSIGRRAAVHGRDGFRFFGVQRFDVLNHAQIVEPDFDGLLLHHLGIEEGVLLGAAPEIIPDIFIERADLGRGTQNRRHFFARGRAGFDLGNLVGLKDIAPVRHGWRTGAKSQYGAEKKGLAKREDKHMALAASFL